MTEQEKKHTMPLAEPLTEREREILSLVGQQWTNRQIAEELVLAHSTVRWYLRQIYAKLGVAGRGEAVARARALGLVASPMPDSLTTGNLPAAATPFLGRQVELQALDEILLDPHVRLVTIIGPGGIGKTRLAQALAGRQARRRVSGSDRLLFPDGVWYTSFAPIESAPQVVPVVAEALNLQLEPAGEGGRTPERQVAEFLRRKRLLLVLDNLEHLPDTAPVLARMMAGAPELKMLVTSRRRLYLKGEHLFWIQGLEVPEEEGIGAEAARSDAVRLFAQVARHVKPAFSMGEADVAAVARICRLLEGMPLAVELAASWAGVLSPEAIEREVAQGLDILAGELQDVPPRHRSIRAALDISWQRLSGADKDLFCRLSVFRGGFTLEAARAVAEVTPQALRRLVERSWLAQGEGGRFQVHELLRQFGGSKLQEKPDVEREGRDRHAATFIDFLQRRESAWYGERQGQLLREVQREASNVRVAWTWAAAQGQVPLMAGGLDGLCAYYECSGNEGEARALLRAASETLSGASVRTNGEIARQRLLVRVWSWAARFASSVEAGLETLDQAEVVLAGLRRREVDVRREEALFVLRRGEIEMLADPEAARPYLERALSIYEEADDTAGTARATTALGVVAWHLGDYPQAADLLRRGLEGHEAVGNRRGMAQGLELLGLIEKHRGRLVEAVQAHHESYALYRDLGSRSDAANMAATLSYTLCWSGELAEAHSAGVDGLQLAGGVGSRLITGYVQSAIAQACVHLGSYDEGQHYAGRAIELACAAGDRQTLGWALFFSGQLSLVAQEDAEAVARLEEAATVLAEYKKSIWFLPLVSAVFSLRRMGQRSRACRTLAKALRENMSQRVSFVAVNTLPIGALLLADEGEEQWALELYRLAQRYPYVANSRWFYDMAGQELEAVAACLPPGVAAAAQEGGRARELWQTAEELLVQFGANTV